MMIHHYLIGAAEGPVVQSIAECPATRNPGPLANPDTISVIGMK